MQQGAVAAGRCVANRQQDVGVPLVSAPAAFQAFHFAVSSSAIGISAGRISP